LIFVSISVTFSESNLAHRSDAARQALPDRGASAVPAGGFATRSRAASGISLPAL